jgi:RNA polymerase sigma-70 factor (ECF subfamily)
VTRIWAPPEPRPRPDTERTEPGLDTDIPDGDLVRLARCGEDGAFRILVERHAPAARARASRLCPNPSDVDDIVQESFLRAFVSLDRLRDPDRFAGWLAGIVHNVCRAARRQAPLTLLPDWPEPLHPASAEGVPSPDDLDRADAVREAVAGLPAGQRRAVALYYYADLPADQIAEPPGAARASLHKARLRLRRYITEHRPDLVPAESRRRPMTPVRIARVERRARPGPRRPVRSLTHVVVLADDAGGRELEIWLLGSDGHRIERLSNRAASGDAVAGGDELARSADELAGQLLRLAGATVTGVGIDELGPDVTAARIELTGPAGTRNVTARLAEGLAVALTTGAPVRVADPVMARLAVPARAVPPTDPAQRPPDLAERPGGPGAVAAPAARPAVPPRPGRFRPRYEPRNLSFADGLDHWLFFGNFAEHASESHWHDYACSIEDGVAVISSTVPDPAGFAVLGQEMKAEDYRGAAITFRGEFRTDAPAGRAGLFLRVNEGHSVRGPLVEADLLADPDNNVTPLPATSDWTRHKVTARVPDDGDGMVFGVFLAAPGRLELRHAELTRSSLQPGQSPE